MKHLVLFAVFLGLTSTVLADDVVLRRNPLFGPTLSWLENPMPCKDSVAKTETEMKPYTETLPGTAVTFRMVPIPGGKFLLGSPEDEPGRRDDEGPRHEVDIEPFWMEEHETTWKEFELYAIGGLSVFRKSKKERTEREKAVDAFAQPTPPYDLGFISYDKVGYGDYPASGMTPHCAQMYCKWLTIITGRYYRLPTEAEWEYACRAGASTAYSFGDDPSKLDEYAWYFGNTDGGGYEKVKRKKPNRWGLYDMHGNVAECVIDLYRPDTYAQRHAGKLREPFLPKIAKWTGSQGRVFRGGHCDDADPADLRCARRLYSTGKWSEQDPAFPQSSDWYTDAPFVGFRVVRPLNPPKTAEEAKFYEVNPEIWFDTWILNRTPDEVEEKKREQIRRSFFQ